MRLYYITSPQVQRLCDDVFLPSVSQQEPQVDLIPVPIDQIGGNGDYRSEEWNRIILLKTLALMQAVEDNLGEIIAYLDVDIVCLRPFVKQALALMDRCDVRGQLERPDLNIINTGVLFLRCSKRLSRVFADTLRWQLQVSDRAGQELFTEKLQASGLRWDFLPPSFANGTNGGLGPDSVLYHATCTFPNTNSSSVAQKLDLLHAMMLLTQV